MEDVKWRKASRSGTNGENCVELARMPDAVVARDSKDPDGSKLVFGATAFGAFARRVKAGELDLG